MTTDINSLPASQLTLEQFAQRAGVPVTQIGGTAGNFVVLSAPAPSSASATPVTPVVPATPPTPAPAPAPTQPTQTPQQTTTYTPPQFTNNNNQVYKEWNPNTNSWDVKTLAGKAVSLEEFKNQGLNIDHINTQDTVQRVVQSGTNVSGGGTSGETGAPATDPYKTFIDNYNSLIESSGMPTIKSEIDKILKESADLTTKMSEEVMNINDNPWLSEGLRTKKVGLIQDKYQTQQDALTRRQTLYQNLYDSAKQNAQFQATQATNIAHDQAVLDQQLLIEKMQEADKLASAKKDTSITEVNGRKLLIDNQTGKTIADLGKATSGTTTETDKQVAEANAIQQTLTNSRRGGQFVDGNVYLDQKAKSRMSPTEFDGRFGALLSPSDQQKYGVGTQSPTTFKANRLQELLIKSNNGQSLDSLTPAEQAELYSLL